MINIFEVNETNKMIEHENLDVRTITMGISLLDCVDSDLKNLTRIFTIRSPTARRIWWRPERRSPWNTGFPL